MEHIVLNGTGTITNHVQIFQKTRFYIKILKKNFSIDLCNSQHVQ